MGIDKIVGALPTDKEIEKFMPGILKQIPQASICTSRRIANVITHNCFRNTEIENIHVNYISDKEMMKTMIEASAKVDFLIRKKKIWDMRPSEVVDYCLFSSFHNIGKEMPKDALKKLRMEATRKIYSTQLLYRERPALFDAYVKMTFSSVQEWDKTTIWNGQQLKPRRGVKPKEPGHQYLQKIKKRGI
ncbi:MAG: hypothetical protein WC861_01160 [Candidatus Micrarchaeia archaeon]|jgi:hypothetical protein